MLMIEEEQRRCKIWEWYDNSSILSGITLTQEIVTCTQPLLKYHSPIQWTVVFFLKITDYFIQIGQVIIKRWHREIR